MPAANPTFLFTDIEGSTRAWEREPDAMAKWLARHDEILTSTIAEFRGHMFKHTGDGVCAVFPAAADAAAAAIEAQRRLTGVEGERVGPIRVRIALHSGEAFARAGDFYGPTLNRCARVLEAGHGGQILVSSTAAEAIPGGTNKNFVLVDLGMHRLRDLQRAEHLWQLAAEGLEGEFPPLSSLDVYTHNLPVQRSSFVGRDTEIKAVSELLVGQRLTTISGVGGCGKTRLALAVAAANLDRFADGVYFVDLSTLSEPALVGSTIAAAFRMPATSASIEDRLTDYLADLTTLIVLDNCEHLLDTCAEVVDGLLARCRNLRVLATSREPLAVEGEQVWRVRSLALPQSDSADEIAESEAVRLFVDRAAAVRPGFALKPESAGPIAEICRRLDGIPLAIELAAARVAHLSPADIASRLDDRFRLLASGRRGVQRQQTLHAALDWSYELLSEPERMLLARMSAFAGSFDLAAVESVCSTRPLAANDALDLLGALVARSLLMAEEHDESTRYRLLETVRLYAQEKLIAAGEAEATRDAHAHYYLRLGNHFERTLVESAPMLMSTYKERRHANSDEYTHELDNVRQAAEWFLLQADHSSLARLVTSLVALFLERARQDEADEWLRVCVQAPSLSPELRTRCLAAWAGVAELQGNFLLANERARAAIELDADIPSVCRAYGVLIANMTWIDRDEAARVTRALADYGRRVGVDTKTYVQRAEAMLAIAHGEYDRAVLLLSARDFTGAGLWIGPNVMTPDWIGADLVLASVLAGDYVTANAALASAGERPGWLEYYVHYLGALVAAGAGDHDTARNEAREAMTAVRRWKVPLGLVDCVVACAVRMFHTGDTERASELLACAHAASGGNFRTPASVAVYRHYVREVRRALTPEQATRARVAGAQLTLEAALARELG